MKRASFVGGALAFGAAASARGRALAGGAVEIPFFFTHGYIAFEARVGGARIPVAALLNTGFDASFLDARTARAAGLTLSDAAVRVAGDGPDAYRYWSLRETLGAGDLQVANARVICDDATRATVRDIGVDAQLLLGFEPFATRVLQIDYPRRLLRVLDVAPATPPNAFATALTAEQYQPQSPKLLTFEGLVVDGQTVAAQIDTLWPKSAIVFPSKLARPLTLGPSDAAHERYEDADLEPGRVATVGVGAHALAAPGIVYVPRGADANVPTTRLAAVVGNGLFATSVVTFDFPNARLTVAAAA